MNWSPYEIKMVLHFYATAAAFENCSAPIYAPTIDKLVKAGVLIKSEDTFGVTELGEALVKMWCETPLPVRTYVDPRTMERAE